MPRGKYERTKKVARMETSVELASAHAVIDGLKDENVKLKDDLRQARLTHAMDLAEALRTIGTVVRQAG